MVRFGHAKASTSNTRRVCVPRPESVGGGATPVPKGGRLRGVRAHYDRGPCAASPTDFGLVCHADALAFRGLAAGGGGSDGLLPLAGAHPAMRWHVAHNTVGRGHLYQGRFKSFPVAEDGHFLTVCRYVERNALTANVVRRAEDWRWGSLWARRRAARSCGRS